MSGDHLPSNRTQVGAAITALLQNVRWGTPERGFAYTSERLQTWDDCPAQPALYVVEGDERRTQVTNMGAVREWEYRVVVYQDTGRDTSLPRPATENDLILDALEARIEDVDTPDDRQTLGGLCHRARIDGPILKDSGDLDGQAMIVFSIWVMVP